jgi:predicted RNA-binding protein with PIN domain
LALHLIIDGYNLMGAARGGGLNPGVDLEFSREALLKRLHTFRIRKPLRITVVFDGKEAKTTWESRAGIRVAFAGGRGRADEAIAGMVRGNPQGVVVATSDRALAENCRRMGAAVISSQELWGRLERALGYREAGLELPKEDSWEEESLGGWGSKKKGPARRLSRKERRQARKLRKL